MPYADEIQISHDIRTRDELEADVRAQWEAALRVEGFGVRQVLQTAQDIDVQWELDSIVDTILLMAHIGNSRRDRENRERGLIEFVEAVFSHATLRRTIIPRRTWVPKVVRNVAMLYKQSPERWITKSEAVDEAASTALTSIYDKAHFNGMMKQAYRKFVLSRCIAIRPAVRGGRLAFDVLHPGQFRYLLNDNDELEKFCYSMELRSDGFKENAVAVWTATENYILNAHGERIPVPGNDTGVNPYGVIPYVIVRQGDGYGDGGYDLVECVNYFNFLQLLLTDDTAFAALGVWLGKNLGLMKDEGISPRTLLAFDDVAELQGKNIPPSLENISGSPQGDLLARLQEWVWKNANIAEGISPAMLETQVREMSGKALAQMKAELLERREDDAEVMESAEREVYGMTAKVLAYHRKTKEYQGDTLPEDSELFHVDFTEQETSDLTPAEELELDKSRMDLGLVSIVDVFRKTNPDVDDEEDIMEQIEKNRAQMQRLKSKGYTGGLFSDLLGKKEEQPNGKLNDQQPANDKALQ